MTKQVIKRKITRRQHTPELRNQIPLNLRLAATRLAVECSRRSHI